MQGAKEFHKERVAHYRWEAMDEMAVGRLEFAKKNHELKTGDPAKKLAKRMAVAA